IHAFGNQHPHSRSNQPQVTAQMRLELTNPHGLHSIPLSFLKVTTILAQCSHINGWKTSMLVAASSGHHPASRRRLYGSRSSTEMAVCTHCKHADYAHVNGECAACGCVKFEAKPTRLDRQRT